MTVTVTQTDDVLGTARLADIPQIFAANVQILHWQRPLPAGIDNYLAQMAADGLLRLGYRGELAAGESPTLAAWPAGAGRQVLEADIALLADLYATLLDCPRVGWRVEVLYKAMCPRFHVDRTGIRLVTTWRGAGTEWLAEADADRSKLGAASGGLPDEQSGLMCENKVGRSVTGDVVLLKGSLWQGNAGRGAIHRSPACRDTMPRVMLALDALWD